MRSKLIKAVMLTAVVVVAALVAYLGPRWFAAKPPEPATAAAPAGAAPTVAAPAGAAPAGSAASASASAPAAPAPAGAVTGGAEPAAAPAAGPASSQQAAAQAAAAPAGATPAAPIAPPPGPAAAPSASPTSPAQPPAFDVVRVEPTGEAVVAGRAAPDAVVRLKAGDAVVAEGRADAAGQFVLLPPPLAAGEHLLTLDTGAGDASQQSVSVRVPAKGQGEVVVAIVEPNQPTRLLSDQRKETAAKPAGAPVVAATPAPQTVPAPQTASAPQMTPAPAAPSGRAGPVVVRTVEAEEGGAFYATGSAAPGAKVRIYLNDAFLAEAPVAADGKWSMRVEKGMLPGAYRVRADQTEAAGPKVVARAEIAFNYPTPADAAAKPQPASSPGVARPTVAPPAPVSAPSPAASGGPAKVAAAAPPASDAGGQPGAAPAPAAGVTVPEVRTANVTRGDSLWRISRKIYGSGLRYTEIFEANPAQIRDPDLIYPGQILVVPKQN
ncbi:MAG: LysM peptidoglycan-binding domain-containing protein [Rhizobiales bacterium]|nr:LysM peptidoglycan-binding domain-containing protein [Hyphomicrobiales bacterium]